MPNNTETYWEADGESLHTFARSIETLSGLGPPALRGSDIVIPLQPGEDWVPKVHGPNTLTLAMWLRGVSQDAGSGVTAENKARYQSNWNDLIRLLWTPGRQVSLRKRFYDNMILRHATALAEYAGGLQPTLRGNSAARCTIDMKIAKGVFYHDTETVEQLATGNNSIFVLGNAPTTRIFVSVAGARTNPKVRNQSLGVEFTYPRSILSGQNIVVDVENYLVDDSTMTPDMGPAIIHTGAPQWLLLKPGENIINVSDTAAGTGQVTLRYRAAWV